MKTFSMSQYPNMETLLAAKVGYLTGFTMELLDRLVDLEEVELDEASGKYYWVDTGYEVYE